MSLDLRYRVSGLDKLLTRLDKLVAAGEDMTPLMDAIAGVLEDVAEESFATETSPDGDEWPALSEVTRKRRARAGHDGAILQVSGRLAASIGVGSIGKSHVTVGTNVIYAAVQQFGAQKGAFGKGRRAVPWGDIPAREFLGVSKDALREIDELVTWWLRRAR